MALTALPIHLDVEDAFRGLGGHLEHHRFEWLSTQPVDEQFFEPTIVIGSAMAADGLIALDAQGIRVLPAGRLLVRSVCMVFDAYLEHQNRQRFSRVI